MVVRGVVGVLRKLGVLLECECGNVSGGFYMFLQTI